MDQKSGKDLSEQKSTMAAMVRGVKRMDPRTTAVLVCDVQERFREVILGFDALCKCSAFVIKVADKLDIPVVVTEQYSARRRPARRGARNPDAKIRYPKAFGATVAELKSVLPADQQFFDKTMFSMCTESVRAELTRLGTKSAILCGLETHVCVYQTTLDLLEMGIDVHARFRVFPSGGGCGSRAFCIGLHRRGLVPAAFRPLLRAHEPRRLRRRRHDLRVPRLPAPRQQQTPQVQGHRPLRPPPASEFFLRRARASARGRAGAGERRGRKE